MAGPLFTIFRYLFLATDPENFLKAPLVPIYANLEEGARAKNKHDFWSKDAFFGPFFQQKLAKTGSF